MTNALSTKLHALIRKIAANAGIANLTTEEVTQLSEIFADIVGGENIAAIKIVGVGKGTIYYVNEDLHFVALPKANDDDILVLDNGVPKWVTKLSLINSISGGTVGDIYYCGADGVMTALPKANDGDILVLDAGVPKWGAKVSITTSVSGGATPGEMYYCAADGVMTAIPPGTEGQVLKMVSGVPMWTI